MISITNKIASDSNISVWVVPEDVPGVLKPPAAEHLVGAFDVSYPTQVPEYSNSKERALTRDVLERCQGSMPAGEFGFSTYVRPDGLGIPPCENELLIALMGLETVNVGVDVIYNLKINKSSCSIWFLVDHTMTFCAGATIGGLKVNLADCSLTYEWTGQFMRMGIAGTDPLTGAVNPSTHDFLVTTTDKYSIGGLVVLADAAGAVVDDNNGTGYVIESITEDVSINVSTLTIVGVGDDGVVAPFNPGGTLSGNKLETRHAVVEIGGVDKPIIDFTIEIVDQPEYLAREKTPSGYPEGYAEIQREVSGELVIAFRRDDAIYFKQAIEGKEQHIKLKVGALTGYMVEFSMPRSIIEVPAIEEDTPIVQLNMPYQAIATVAEDSYAAKYL